MIECRVLGPVEVLVDGGAAPAELLWRKHLALLLYLARSPKRARTREHLTGLLWPEKEDAAARHSLNEALRVLRRAGLDESVDTAGGQVRLGAAAVRLDCDALEEHLARGEHREGAALIAGTFLEGFSVPGCPELEDWLETERRHWTSRSLVALAGWSAALLREGRGEEGLEVARRAETLDHTSDLAARAMMSAHAALGDAAAALALAERFAATLEREVGSAPDPETLQLAERIRRGRPGARLAPPRPAEPERRRAPLVGRAGELARLLDLFERGAAAPSCGVAILEGESGTGKSRLLEEFSRRVVLQGGAVATMRAVETDQATPGSVLLGLAQGGLLSMPGVPAAPPEALAGFAAALPDWADRFGRRGTEGAWPASRGLGAVLAAALSESPVVLAIDDAHWVDAESLGVLLAAVRDSARAPLLLVLTTLPHPAREALDQLRRKLGGEIAGTALMLGPLRADEIRTLAAWALPAYDPVALDRVCRRVASDSAGIPFLAVELLSAVAQGLDLQAGRAAWPEPMRTLTQSLPADLPDSVVAAVRIGFNRLSSDARQVLAAAALLGDRVTESALATATELPRDRVEPALDELEWQRWLEVDGQGYGFVASLARRVVADDMLTPGQRRRILERAARPAP